MEFQIDRAVEILARTPAVLRSMLGGLSDAWATSREGPDTWSPFDVVGHLIHGDETDWIARLRIILQQGESRPFDPFDRFAQFDESRGRTLEELLDTFEELREKNLQALAQLDLQPAQLDLTGVHPELGRVTARQLLATWVVHDLAHIAQIARAMAAAYAEEVGPWRAYLRVVSG
jgi:uncharacterized damage-inducible protein DinB